MTKLKRLLGIAGFLAAVALALALAPADAPIWRIAAPLTRLIQTPPPAVTAAVASPERPAIATTEAPARLTPPRKPVSTSAASPERIAFATTKAPVYFATSTPIVSATSLPSSATAAPRRVTAIPSATPVPPTVTAVPSATPIPATPVPPQAACYRADRAWLLGEMNIRQRPDVASPRVGGTLAGESYPVLDSRAGADYCWLRIERGWMALTALVSASAPQSRVESPTSGDAQSALNALQALIVAPENRCSAYDSDDYPYSQSVEPQIVARMGGRIYGPYTGATFASIRQTDIEHIVARSEAHDSGLCAADLDTRRRFASDLLNLTLASPGVNRRQKIAKDFAEWTPPLNICWYAAAIVKVKYKYRLTVDRSEKTALENALRFCPRVQMIFAANAVPVASGQSAGPASAQPASNPQPPADGSWRQWDANGNGKISCKEARDAGIAPVRLGHPAYPHMNDRDGDGIVCEN